MRLLIVTHNYPRAPGDRSGAFVAELAVATARAGHDVAVVAPHAPGSAVRERVDDVDVRRFRYAPESLERVAYRGDLHRSALRSLEVALFLPAFLAAFHRAVRVAVREHRPDLVHAHWWIPGAALAVGAGSAPLVITCHGSDVRLLAQSAALRALGRRTLSAARAVTTVSSFLAEQITRCIPSLERSPLVLPLPVDPARFEPDRAVGRADPPRILYAGNLVPSKGVDVLIDAFARLRARGLDCRLRIVGEGPLREALRRQTETLGVAEDVEWSGFVPQHRLAAEYAASWVTVLPSRAGTEGLGLTLVESLMAGTPVVGSATGGIPDVVEHDRTGLLAEAGDAQSLATQLERMLREPATHRRLAEEGRRHVLRRHDPSVAVSRFLDLYRTVAPLSG